MYSKLLAREDRLRLNAPPILHLRPRLPLLPSLLSRRTRLCLPRLSPRRRSCLLSRASVFRGPGFVRASTRLLECLPRFWSVLVLVETERGDAR